MGFLQEPLNPLIGGAETSTYKVRSFASRLVLNSWVCWCFTTAASPNNSKESRGLTRRQLRTRAADATLRTCPEGGHVARGRNHRGGGGRGGLQVAPGTHPLLHVTEQVRNNSSCSPLQARGRRYELAQTRPLSTLHAKWLLPNNLLK